MVMIKMNWDFSYTNYRITYSGRSYKPTNDLVNDLFRNSGTLHWIGLLRGD